MSGLTTDQANRVKEDFQRISQSYDLLEEEANNISGVVRALLKAIKLAKDEYDALFIEICEMLEYNERNKIKTGKD